MLNIQSFTFNPYQENTYVVSDQTGSCVIIDPGCYTQTEEQALQQYISSENLKVEKLLNTHGHIDHMLGNYFVKQTYDVPFVTHEKVIGELEATKSYGALMGLTPTPSPMPDQLVDHGDTVEFGETVFEVFFTPGHSPGHISFFHRESKNLFSGDVLFMGSIGRTDLPGGSFPVLMKSIYDHLLMLDDEVKVHCGHGPETTIGRERYTNGYILKYPPQ